MMWILIVMTSAGFVWSANYTSIEACIQAKEEIRRDMPYTNIKVFCVRRD